MRAEGPAGRPLALCGVALVAVCGGCAPTTPAVAPAPAAPVRLATGAGCDDAVELPLGRVVVGSTEGARDTLSVACGSGEAPERVYRFEVPQRSQFRASLQADFDAVLAVRARCSHPERELACNDDVRRGQSERSQLQVTLSPGTHYLIVDGAQGSSGDFELFAFLDPIEPPELACAEAAPLAFDEVVHGSTRGVADRFEASCGHGARAGEQVFALAIDEPSRLRVWQQAEHDGVLYLRERCADPGSELACNDDFRGSHHSLLTARVGAGTHYLFSDGLEGPQSGTFSLRVERGPLEPGPRSLGAVCEAATALPIAPGLTALDTFYEPSLAAGSCGGGGAPESVFAVEVREPSRLRARLRETELNAVLYLRDTCALAERELACEVQARVDRGRAPGQPRAHGLDVEVAPGSYFLFVDGQSEDDFGAAHLELDLFSLAELQARCEAAPRLRDGDVVEGRLTAGPDLFGASCGGEARGTEKLYGLRLSRRSLVQLELDSSFDGVLYLRSDCVEPGSELECNDDAGHSRRSSLTRLLEPGSYLVGVDGFGPEDRGPYRLSVHLSPEP